MSLVLILSFSTFFISLLGTKWVIFTLKKRALSPDIDLLMGRRAAPPLADAGIALTFALIIGMLGAEASFALVLPLFLPAGLALLKPYLRIPQLVKFMIWGTAVAVGLTIFPMLITAKILAGVFWMMVIVTFSKLEKTENFLPLSIIFIGLGLALANIFTGTFPSELAMQSLIFASAGFGFLWWNWQPARVFAGEIGAVPAGFVAGYLLLLMVQSFGI
jgi:UDP-N-acetylmuramyl pentapeptide phosphotransferase/UDP-N-acetylglucosamine-1-phosphate transferase